MPGLGQLDAIGPGAGVLKGWNRVGEGARGEADWGRSDVVAGTGGSRL